MLAQCLGKVTVVRMNCVGASEAMQHPDHADREGEHGAGGEGES